MERQREEADYSALVLKAIEIQGTGTSQALDGDLNMARHMYETSLRILVRALEVIGDNGGTFAVLVQEKLYETVELLARLDQLVDVQQETLLCESSVSSIMLRLVTRAAASPLPSKPSASLDTTIATSSCSASIPASVSSSSSPVSKTTTLPAPTILLALHGVHCVRIFRGRSELVCRRAHLELLLLSSRDESSTLRDPSHVSDPAAHPRCPPAVRPHGGPPAPTDGVCLLRVHSLDPGTDTALASTNAIMDASSTSPVPASSMGQPHKQQQNEATAAVDFVLPMVPLLPVLRCGLTSISVACSAEELFGFVFTGGELDADAFEFYLSATCDVRSVLDALVEVEQEAASASFSSSSSSSLSSSTCASTGATASVSNLSSSKPTWMCDEQAITQADAEPEGNTAEDWLAVRLRRTTTGVNTVGSLTVSRVSLLSRVLSRRVERSGDWLQRRMRPGTHDAEVPVLVQASLRGLSRISPVLVAVSRACIGAVVAGASELGRRTGALARSQERRLKVRDDHEEPEDDAQRSCAGDQQGEESKPGRFDSERWMAARELAGESATSFVAVWNSLFEAGDQLSSVVADNTAEVVGHRYGEAASEACRDGLNIGIDLVKTTYFARQLGMESAALLVARESGRAAITGESQRVASQQSPAGELSGAAVPFEIPGTVAAGSPVLF